MAFTNEILVRQRGLMRLFDEVPSDLLAQCIDTAHTRLIEATTGLSGPDPPGSVVEAETDLALCCGLFLPVRDARSLCDVGVLSPVRASALSRRSGSVEFWRHAEHDRAALGQRRYASAINGGDQLCHWVGVCR